MSALMAGSWTASRRLHDWPRSILASWTELPTQRRRMLQTIARKWGAENSGIGTMDDAARSG